jgi:hypothetical protein
MTLNPKEFVNTELLFDWKNWAVVYVIGAIGLLMLHSLISGFGGDTSSTPPSPYSLP